MWCRYVMRWTSPGKRWSIEILYTLTWQQLFGDRFEAFANVSAHAPEHTANEWYWRWSRCGWRSTSWYQRGWRYRQRHDIAVHWWLVIKAVSTSGSIVKLLKPIARWWERKPENTSPLGSRWASAFSWTSITKKKVSQKLSARLSLWLGGSGQRKKFFFCPLPLLDSILVFQPVHFELARDH